MNEARFFVMELSAQTHGTFYANMHEASLAAKRQAEGYPGRSFYVYEMRSEWGAPMPTRHPAVETPCDEFDAYEREIEETA